MEIAEKAGEAARANVTGQKPKSSTVPALDTPKNLDDALAAVQSTIDNQQATPQEKREAKKYKAMLMNDSKQKTYNAKGWKLHTDKEYNMAYVSPDRKQFEEVK